MWLKSFIVVLVTLCIPGDAQLDSKIVGGKATKISNVPYQVSVHYLGSHICGGSIISNKHVLTAAHCVHGAAVRKLSVNVGGSYYSLPLQKLHIYRYKEHEKYNSTTSDNDIAILQASDNFSFGPNVLPISLPTQDEEIYPGVSALVSGWGHQMENQGILSLRLRKVNMPIISIERCRQLYRNATITSNMICAGYEHGGKDACQGDSGGPMVANGRLFGITSWGIGCARAEYPGVFTKVSKYRNWIRLYTGI